MTHPAKRAAAASRADRLREMAVPELRALADACLTAGDCWYDPELHDGPADPSSETAGQRAAREQVAAEVCATCAARPACWAYALRARPDRGVWAGLAAADIAAMADLLGVAEEAA